jgi:hypothetical protein
MSQWMWCTVAAGVARCSVRIHAPPAAKNAAAKPAKSLGSAASHADR